MPAAALTRATLAAALIACLALPAAAQKPDARKLVSGEVNAFALDLYGRLAAAEDGNFFVSPYSISAAMALPMLGAGGQTSAEIRAAMHYPEFDSQLHTGMGRLEKSIDSRAVPDTLDLSTANALWAAKSLEISRRYLAHLDRFYGAGLERAGFRSDPETERVRINSWVEDQTRGRIRDLFPAGTITPETRLVVANAIYFKGLWAMPFDTDQTETASFTTADGTVDTDLMHTTADLGYAETDDWQLLELPYLGGDIAMLVMLPRASGGLGAVEEDLAALTVDSLADAVDRRGYRVDVFLPRFTMEYAATLNDVLQQMGMVQAFTPDADFSGLSEKERLMIDLVMHKAFVDVTEEGTEAAAATGIGMKITSVEPPRTSVTFRADHPFVFFIYDRGTGTVLFMGRLMNPAA